MSYILWWNTLISDQNSIPALQQKSAIAAPTASIWAVAATAAVTATAAAAACKRIADQIQLVSLHTNGRESVV